jgi:hypothetical protein
MRLFCPDPEPVILKPSNTSSAVVQLANGIVTCCQVLGTKLEDMKAVSLYTGLASFNALSTTFTILNDIPSADPDSK